MAAGAGMTLAQIDLERPGHDVCAQDVVGVALVALNGVTLDHARPVGKRERLEFGVGTASAVNPVAPSTFDIPALTLPHTVLSREKQVRRDRVENVGVRVTPQRPLNEERPSS